MAKKLELQWTKLGEGVLADWHGAVDAKHGVRLEQSSTGQGWGPWHLRNGETLVSADTLRAKSLVKLAASASEGAYKGVPLVVLEALESAAAAWLKDGGPKATMPAPALRVLLPAFEQLTAGSEYHLDVPGQRAAWKVRVTAIDASGVHLEMEEPGPDLPIVHGPYVFDPEGGTVRGVGEGCTCGGPYSSPGVAHGYVLEAMEAVEAALTAATAGESAPSAPSEERPRIVGVPHAEVRGELLRRWLQAAPALGEGGKLSEAVESLPVPLTPEARLRKADLLTRTYEEDGALDVREKRFKDEMKRLREEVEKRRQTLVAEIQSRTEHRDIRTLEVVVYPLRAVWRVRTDTYEVVQSRPMDLGDQAARVYAEDDVSAPFHSPARGELDEETEDDAPVEPGPRARKKHAPSADVSVTLSAQAVDLEPEEVRRRAAPDATSDMTVAAPVRHRCQRARCGHSEADHFGSSGQCMASIRAERDGMPGETCACTAYVPPPGARETRPAPTPPEPAAPATMAELPEATGEVVESLPDGWLAAERGTGWWLDHADVPVSVGPFFPVAGSLLGAPEQRFFLEQAQGRQDLDEWAARHEDVLGALERELEAGAASYAMHYPLDGAPGWLLAVVGFEWPLTLHLVRGTETSPALAWSGAPGVGALGDDDASVESFVAWAEANPAPVAAANAVIRRGDVRELPQLTSGVALQ